jgi:hypothetical protein
VWLAATRLEFDASTIDGIICPKIPEVNIDPLGYALVDEFMIHGPCGAYNRKCPCMKNDKCSKFFPKTFQNKTITDELGFTIYRRPDDGRYVMKNGVRQQKYCYIQHVAAKKYNAHINVELSNKTNMIKYLFKYINK